MCGGLGDQAGARERVGIAGAANILTSTAEASTTTKVVVSRRLHLRVYDCAEEHLSSQ